MSAISAAAVSLRTLADGTVRVTVDIEPKDAAEAFALFGKPGQPIAVAALRDGHAAVPAAVKPGPLCIEAVRYCEMPEFHHWVKEQSDADAKQFILDQCGIDSRKKLDQFSSAAQTFVNEIRIPFMRYMKQRERAAA